MKIGITERGDAGIDFSWYDKLDKVDGAVIITKKLSDKFNEKLLTSSKPVILHCTCTGWGGSWLEPNVQDFKTQLNYLTKLIEAGFPAENVVLRIDPIIPTEEGVNRAKAILDYVLENKMPISRIRFSIYDEYNHVKDRLLKLGKDPFYGKSFYAPTYMTNLVIITLAKYPFVFETCAEDILASKSNKFISKGCVSSTDLKIMNLEVPESLLENMQNRNGCHCLSCKTELLTSRAQCPNGCVYCYWKPNK